MDFSKRKYIYKLLYYVYIIKVKNKGCFLRYLYNAIDLMCTM